MEKNGFHGTRGRPSGAKSKRFHMKTMHPPLEWEHMAKNNLRPLSHVFKAAAQTFVLADMEVVRWKKLWVGK